MKFKDTITSIVLLGICIIFWVQAKSFSKYGALFPRTIIIILGFLSTILLFKSIIEIFKNKPAKSKIERLHDIRSILITIIIIIVWILFINILGFLTSSIIFYTSMYLLLIKKNTKIQKIIVNLITIIATIFIFYLFFSKLLQVPFPRGILI